MPAAHRIPDCTHVEFFDPTRLTHFDRLDPVLIDGHHADSIDGAGEAASLHSAETYPKALHHTRIDGDAAGRRPSGARSVVRVLCDQLHVHER